VVEYRLLCRIKPYIQPFERELALRELACVAQSEVTSPNTPFAGDSQLYEVVTHVHPNRLITSLAYWESITNGRVDLTAQVKREATASMARNNITPLQLPLQLATSEQLKLPNRRVLRYGPHGIHEYRGKFFPQLVRALINIAGLRRDSLVLDPMSGSGTTAVEALLLHCRARGLDINPLSVLLSRTKCGLLSVSPDRLAEAYLTLRAKILGLSHHQGHTALEWFSTLSEEDRTYLRLWFAPEILSVLDAIMQAIQAVQEGAIRNYFMLALSNILRGVSWQKVDDLRVRKEVHPASAIDPIGDFVTELDRSVKTMLAFLLNDGPLASANWCILEGDATTASRCFRSLVGRVDAIVTSPPYAMALPYLDTDRLSLCYLGLLPRSQHRKRDLQMIGNREVTESQRHGYWQYYEENKSLVPMDVQNLIEHVNNLNLTTEVGFRRRNLPALLAKYFIDMRAVFKEMMVLMRQGTPAYIVVGNNHTIAGGQRIEINTADLLGQIGESIGFRRKDAMPMDMLVSRSIFRKNAVGSESIMCLERA
jgi:site-specific DNA-methyltransferase (cytosine-N4-specific)